MRVAYILNDTRVANGANKALFPLLYEMVAQNQNPLVVVPDKNELYRKFQDEGIDVVALPYRPKTYTYTNNLKDILMFIPRMIARFFVNRYSSRKLEKMFLSRNIQIVHTNTSVIGVGQRAAFSLGIPHIYHVREFADRIGYRYFPSKSSYKKSIDRCGDYTICITRAVQNHLSLGGDRRSVVIYDGIAMSEHPSVCNGSERNYLLYVGRIEFNKGIDILLNAYGLAKECGKVRLPKLKIVGPYKNDEYFHKCQTIIEEMHIDDDVEFLGEQRQVGEIMAKAKAIIIPSRFEGFGLCMPEAMLNGCVCVGYDNTGTKEQFDNGEQLTGNSIGMRYNTSEELKNILLEVASTDDRVYDEMRSRALHTVKTLYTKENNIKSICDFYTKIISKEI